MPRKTAPPRRIEYTLVREIVPADLNPKRHDHNGIVASIRRFGYTEPVLHDERTGKLIAGHGRLEALLAMEDAGEDVPDGVVATDNGWTLPVVRGWSSKSDAEAAAKLAASNRLVEKGGWDMAELAELLGDVQAVDPTLVADAGWPGNEIDEVLRAVEANSGESGSGGPSERDPRDDSVSDPPAAEDTITRVGDLWELGPHRLLCGDASDEAAHRALMGGRRPDLLLLDPPYGMHLNTDWSSVSGSARAMASTPGKVHPRVIGDDADYDPSFILNLYGYVKEQFWWGADYYAERLVDKNKGSWIVWDKREGTQADAIGSEFELCWSKQKHKRRVLRHEWFGFVSAQNSEDARNRLHPNQKPVTLLTDILYQWGAAAQVVADFYGGSGSTLIACHRERKVALLMEISPAYCDVICRRYQKRSGIIPRRNGVEVNFA